MEEEIRKALESIRPYLQADDGDVELVEVTDDGIVKVKLTGDCENCPMSGMTLRIWPTSQNNTATSRTGSFYINSSTSNWDTEISVEQGPLPPQVTSFTVNPTDSPGWDVCAGWIATATADSSTIHMEFYADSSFNPGSTTIYYKIIRKTDVSVGIGSGLARALFITDEYWEISPVADYGHEFEIEISRDTNYGPDYP